MLCVQIMCIILNRHLNAAQAHEVLQVLREVTNSSVPILYQAMCCKRLLIGMYIGNKSILLASQDPQYYKY